MPRQFAALVGFSIALCISAAAFAEDAKPKLKGLIVVGGCCHDYERQKVILSEGLSHRVSIEWDVFHGPNGRDTKLDVYKKDDWIKQYDIVVHNECYGGLKDNEWVEGIVTAHTENGIPAIVIHCSMHSYRAASTDAWRKLLGVTSRRHEGKRQLDVQNVAQDHPIMQGFPRMWRTPNGELYVVEKAWEGATPLATAFGEDTKQDQMCIWTNEHEGAKVFGITLGHHNETMMSREWLDVTARGLLWCVGKLNEDGTPADGFAGTGVKPFSFQKDIGKEPTPAEKN